VDLELVKRREDLGSGVSVKNSGSAIAQVVIRLLPTVVARVRVWVRSCGICDEQSGTRAGFLPILKVSPGHSFHRLLHTHHPFITIWGWYNRPVVATSTVDLVPLHPKKQKKKSLKCTYIQFK
jgi:hypothetical protein